MSETFNGLGPGDRSLIKILQSINYGFIEDLHIRDGHAVLNPPPRIVRNVKIGGENGCRPESSLLNFPLKKEFVELLNHFKKLTNTVVRRIEVKHGLPFSMLVEEDAA